MQGYFNAFLGPGRMPAHEVIGVPQEATLKEKTHKPSVLTVKWQGLSREDLDHPLVKEGVVLSFDLGVFDSRTLIGVRERIVDDYRIKSIARSADETGVISLTLVAHDKSLKLSDESSPMAVRGIRASEFAARVASNMGLRSRIVDSPFVRDSIVVGDKGTLAHKLTEVASEEGYQWYVKGDTLYYEPISDPSTGKVIVLAWGQGVDNNGALVQSWSDTASSLGRKGGKKRQVAGKNPDGSKAQSQSVAKSGNVVVVNYEGANNYQASTVIADAQTSSVAQHKASSIRNARHRASANANAQKFIGWHGNKLKFTSYGTLVRPRDSVRLDGLHSSGVGPWRIEEASTKWTQQGALSQSASAVTPPATRKGSKGKAGGRDGKGNKGSKGKGADPVVIQYQGANNYRQVPAPIASFPEDGQ